MPSLVGTAQTCTKNAKGHHHVLLHVTCAMYCSLSPSLSSVRTFLVLPELTQEVGVWEETNGMCTFGEGGETWEEGKEGLRGRGGRGG